MTSPTPQPPASRPILTGAFAWVLFSVVAVAIRGVRWEETYEHALIITGTVPYPEGHPCYIYCRDVFSGQSWLSALMLWLVDSPLLVNGFRNVLQLAFCTVPVFLLGTRFTGGPRYGHVAAVLVLLGIHRDLQSYYPIESWPHLYAIGQIGTGYALLLLALLLYGCWRWVWFLLGLMVAVHVGQLPVIGAVAGIQWLMAVYRGDRARAVQAAWYFALGLLPCVVFYAIQRHFYVPLPVSGAYAATGDVHAIWAAYTEHYDLHRGFAKLNPFWKSWMGIAFVIALCGTAWTRSADWGESRRDIAIVGQYAALLAGVVGTIWGIHQMLGPNVPFLLIGWMPYRLTNHLAILLVPLALGALLREDGVRPPAWRIAGQGMVVLALVEALLWPVWAAVLPEGIYTRYAGNPEGLLYVLCGAALAAVLQGRGWRAHGVALIVACALPAALYPFALAALLAGAAGWHLLYRLPPGLDRARIPELTGVLAAALLAVLVYQQGRDREQLPVHPLQESVCVYLAERGEADAMLVPPYWDVGWLAKTRHPIFADYQTAHHMTYLPALAPPLKKMHAEVYGFTVDGDAGKPLAEWPGRTAAAWRGLGEAYGFRYVLAPAEMRLQIPPVLEGQPYTLYRVAP